MIGYNGSVTLRNDGLDTVTGKIDLNAGIGVLVTIRVATVPAGTGATVNLFDINDAAIANPVTTDNKGNYFFKVATGTVDIITSEGTPNEVIEPSQAIGQTAELINDLSITYEAWKSVALMQADITVLPVGKKVFWQGYYAESDGGSNWGIVKSGVHTDDGGEFFTLADGKYVQANLKGTSLNIKKFGAKDDLSHDSTVSTQNSLNYVASTRQAWYIPQGKFLITEPLDARAVPSGGTGTGGKFYGDGYASALYYRPDSPKSNPVVPPFSDGDGPFNAGCINFGNDNTRGSIFKDFRITMDEDKENACGLFFYKWFQGHVSNLIIEGAECGIYASFAWSGSITKCNVLSCTNAIIVNNTTIFTIRGNNVGAGSTGITFGWNLYDDNIAQPNEFTQGVTIDENTIQSCSEYAIYGKNTANTGLRLNYTEGNCAGPYPILSSLVGDSKFSGCEVIFDHTDANPYGNSDIIIYNNWFLSNQAATERLLGLKNAMGLDYKNNSSYTTTKFFSGNIPVDIVVSGTVSKVKTDAPFVAFGTGLVQTPRDFFGVRSGAFASTMPQYTLAQLINTGLIVIPATQSVTLLMAVNLSDAADYSRFSFTCADLTGLDLSFRIGSYGDNRNGSLLLTHVQDASASVYDPGRNRMTFSATDTVVLPSGIQYLMLEITNTSPTQVRNVSYPSVTTNVSRGEFAALLHSGVAPTVLLEAGIVSIDPMQMTMLNY